MRAKAVIVAGGAGRRLGGTVAKPFRLLGGIPLYEWGVRAAARSSVASVVLVVPEGAVDEAKRRLSGPLGRRLEAVVAGGAERQDSVRQGTLAAGGCDVVVVHDAARPFATPALFDAVAEAAARDGAAVAAVTSADTVKAVRPDGAVAETLDRETLRLVQTPQAFRRQALLAVLDRAAAERTFGTDEAALFERYGQPVRTVPGDRRNFKITDPADFDLAAALVTQTAERRIGLGEDIHPLVPGRPLVLGGVTVPFEQGLAGHSDADVIAHALIDALCGAAGLPNVGQMFPDTDRRWQGASSLDLLARAVAVLREAGWEPVNADCVVLCDRPRISPHASAMREALGAAAGLPPGKISIKGKSAEGLGPEGRGEGISARVVALVERPGGLVPAGADVRSDPAGNGDAV